MAWEDHEELKPLKYRSDRYITCYPKEYTRAEVIAAARRRIEENPGDFTVVLRMERLINGQG